MPEASKYSFGVYHAAGAASVTKRKKAERTIQRLMVVMMLFIISQDT